MKFPATNPLRCERAVASLELALFAVVLVGALFLVALAWRITEARGQVIDVASEAARAASLVQDPARARQAAADAAAAALAERTVTCSDLDVAVAANELRPAGWVSVTVSCSARLEDLTLLGVPGSTVLTATALEVVDTRRGGE